MGNYLNKIPVVKTDEFAQAVIPISVKQLFGYTSDVMSKVFIIQFNQ